MTGGAALKDRASLLAVAASLVGSAAATVCAQTLVPFTVTANGEITQPLGGKGGDAGRGRAVVFDPERGNCTICHPIPDKGAAGDPRLHGNVAPPLAGVGARLTEGQLRLRLVDGTRINPDTVMPPYYRIDGLARVGDAWRGRPVLQAGDIEDIVAYLQTLKD